MAEYYNKNPEDWASRALCSITLKRDWQNGVSHSELA
jgi:hypothetical protein